MSKTVADLLVTRLIDWGVDAIFGLPGDGVNGIFEALRIHQDKIRFIQVRHEEAAAYARACGAGGFTIEDPATAPAILREALEYDGPAVVQAVIDPYEPPLPGNVTVKQAIKFGEALLRGQKDRWEIIKAVAEDKIREVI